MSQRKILDALYIEYGDAHSELCRLQSVEDFRRCGECGASIDAIENNVRIRNCKETIDFIDRIIDLVLEQD